jgi:hypothetical protein
VVSCKGNQVLNVTGNQCVKKCPSGQYLDVTGTRCVETCTLIHKVQEKCVLSCGPGEVVGVNSRCVRRL